MPYDFETVVNRRGAGSEKWELMLAAEPSLPDDIVPLSVGDMELKTAPEIVEGLKEYLDATVLGYTVPTDAYRRAVLSWFERRHGWKAEPEWMVQIDGVVPAVYAAVRAYTRPGDGVIVMPPVYYPFFRAASLEGRRTLEAPLLDTPDGYRIDFQRLEEAAADPSARLLLLCSPHNPVCRVWTAEELEKIGRICLRHKVIVLSDEIHMDFVMPGHKHRVFASLGPEFADNSLICTAPSKTFNIAGLQTSNILIPNPRLRAAFRNEYLAGGREGPNILGLAACRIAYERAGPWLDRLLVLLRSNAEMIRAFMAEHYPEIRVFPYESTFFLWLDFRAWGLGHKELEQFMVKKAQLFLDEGYIFGTGGAGYERFNLACPAKTLEAALERLRRASPCRAPR